MQELLGHLAGLDIAEVRPGLALGGAGPIPSGSISRLYVVFVLGAALWTRYSSRTAAGFLLTGQALLLIELTSRLYLGRHFLVDIAGGLLLGVLLLIGGGWLLAGIESARGTRPAREADRSPAGVPGGT
ncbi:MAG TPA: phosphatase PAP2 family protein [Microbacterium sp.]|nr:phosphatase PAP2 family protein [Microbacterium sp.]